MGVWAFGSWGWGMEVGVGVGRVGGEGVKGSPTPLRAAEGLKQNVGNLITIGPPPCRKHRPRTLGKPPLHNRASCGQHTPAGP